MHEKELKKFLVGLTATQTMKAIILLREHGTECALEFIRKCRKTQRKSAQLGD